MRKALPLPAMPRAPFHLINVFGRVLLLVVVCRSLPQNLYAQEQRPSTYSLLVFSAPVAGQEDVYNKWYDSQYAPDVVAVPGFVTAQRFVLSDTQFSTQTNAPFPKYLAIYKIVTNDLSSVYAELQRRLKRRAIPTSPAFDSATSVSFIYKAIRPEVYRKRGLEGPHPGSKIYYHLVFTDPVPGREDEYNQWYDGKHMPYMVAAPGFVSAQRYIRRDTNGQPRSTKYLVLYKILTDDLASDIAEYRRAPRLPGSPASGQYFAYTYRAIGPVIEGDKVRFERAHQKR